MISIAARPQNFHKNSKTKVRLIYASSDL